MELEWLLGISYLVGGGVAGGLAGGLVAALRDTYRRKYERRQAFLDTIKLCSLEVARISSLGAPHMKIEAQTGPVSLLIEDLRDLKREYSILVVVRFPGPPGFAGVRIRREMYKPAGAREVEVGDEQFDSAFYVEGPTRLLSVLLDAQTRLQLVNVNAKGRLLIACGEIRVETWDLHFASILPLLLQITRRFMEEEVNIAQRLAENARQDPVPGVRLRNLLILVREFPREPGTREILRAACADSSPQVRLRAALELGAEGREVLFEVAESLKDDESSAQAVVHLGRELTFERTRALLAVSLRKPCLQTARACLEAIGTSGDPEAVDALTNVLAAESDLATAAAVALGATGSPEAEPPLLRALQRARPDLRVAAATALGRVGTAAAVLPLKDASASSRRDQDLHRATRQAIAEIQARLGGASPGQLSLAGAEAGRLSLPDAEGGELSIATDPAGRLSLPAENQGNTSPNPPLDEISRKYGSN